MLGQQLSPATRRSSEVGTRPSRHHRRNRRNSGRVHTADPTSNVTNATPAATGCAIMTLQNGDTLISGAEDGWSLGANLDGL